MVKKKRSAGVKKISHSQKTKEAIAQTGAKKAVVKVGGVQANFYKSFLQSGWMYLLFLLPFIRGRIYLGADMPKFFFSSIVIFLLLLVAAIGIFKKKLLWPKTPFSRPIMGYLFIFAITTIVSINPLMSLLGAYPYPYTGSFTVLTRVLLVYLVLLSQPSLLEAKRFLRTLSLIGLFISTQAILEYYGIWGIGDALVKISHRSVAFLQNSDFTISYLLFLLPICIYFYLKEIKVVQKLIFLITSIANLYALYTLSPTELQEAIGKFVSSWAGGAAALFVLFFALIPLFERRIKFTKRVARYQKQLKFFGLFIALSLILLSALKFGAIRHSVTSFIQSPSNSERFWGWQAGIENGKNHPLFGSGPGTITYFLPEIREKIPFENWNDKTTTFNTHNEAIDHFAMAGIFGLIVYLVLWGYLFIALIKSIKNDPEERPLSIALLVSATLFFGLNQFLFVSMGTMYLPWVLLALVAILAKRVEYISIDNKMGVLKAKVAPLFTFCLSAGLLVGLGFYWLADYYTALGVDRKYETPYLKKSADLFPFIDDYWLNYGYYHYEKDLIMKVTQERQQLEPAAINTIFSESRTALERAIKLDPYYTKNWIAYGMVLVGQNQMDGKSSEAAEAAFSKAKELDPLSDMLRMRIATGYIFIDKQDKAKEYLDEALNLANNQTKADVLITYGKYYLNINKKDKAAEKFREAKNYLSSESPELEYYLNIAERK